MTSPSCSFAGLVTALSAMSDRELLNEVEQLARHEQQATAHLIASLAELDERRLYREAGCASLFTYCTQVLHLSEHAAYRRIEAARTARKFPLVLERLAEGALTLTALGLLAAHLTAENHSTLLDRARHQRKREIELLVAGICPQPDAPALIRRLPEPRRGGPMCGPTFGPACEPASESVCASVCGPMCGPTCEPVVADDRTTGQSIAEAHAPATITQKRPAVVTPLAPERYKVQVTVGAETHAKLRRAQDLLRHIIPDGDPAAILDRALTLLVKDLEQSRQAATNRPHAARETASTSRHIPAAVKRAVWVRDEGRCTFTGTRGRCTERGFLQVHHRLPFASGGPATADNLDLRCAAHNALEADRHFGKSVLRERRRRTATVEAQATP